MCRQVIIEACRLGNPPYFNTSRYQLGYAWTSAGVSRRELQQSWAPASSIAGSSDLSFEARHVSLGNGVLGGGATRGVGGDDIQVGSGQ